MMFLYILFAGIVLAWVLISPAGFLFTIGMLILLVAGLAFMGTIAFVLFSLDWSWATDINLLQIAAIWALVAFMAIAAWGCIENLKRRNKAPANGSKEWREANGYKEVA